MVFATGLLGSIIDRLAPPQADDGRTLPVSPFIKICLLEMLVALSAPSYEESPYLHHAFKKTDRVSICKSLK